MGMMEKLKGMFGQRSDKADEGITKAGDGFDERTGDEHGEHVDTAQEAGRDALGGDQPGGEPR